MRVRPLLLLCVGIGLSACTGSSGGDDSTSSSSSSTGGGSSGAVSQGSSRASGSSAAGSGGGSSSGVSGTTSRPPSSSAMASSVATSNPGSSTGGGSSSLASTGGTSTAGGSSSGVVVTSSSTAGGTSTAGTSTAGGSSGVVTSSSAAGGSSTGTGSSSSGVVGSSSTGTGSSAMGSSSSSGMPAVCGDGVLAVTEQCDDNNTAAGDGCDGSCAQETGYSCTGMPSTCVPVCGDGRVVGSEACDDNNAVDGDGCSAVCAQEPGFVCAGMPSLCAAVCGDGQLAGPETCDDTNTTAGDGCSDVCQQEMGYLCVLTPSVCSPVCGDGIIILPEECDDANPGSGDGCSSLCALEAGFTCSGQPTLCTANCGDGQVVGAETCDDANTTAMDGCSASCTTEGGWVCNGTPSTCMTVCGDGAPAGAETCDDANQVDGDGCSATCAAEPGYNCSGAPSVCAGVCGDGILLATEACDDGNLTDGDCCSAGCGLESGCEVEPNDTTATANAFAALAQAGVVKGVISPTTDVDVFLISIPAGFGGNVAVAINEVVGGPTCTSNNLDSFVSLLDATGTALANDDDSGVGLCSALTRNGLTAGDYFVLVRRSTAGAATFPYALQVTVTLTQCGNGVLEAGELCDDGNLANGDGCTDTCRLEAFAETEPNGTCAAANGPLPLPPNKLVAGAMNPQADSDWYAFNLTSYADVRVETFDSTGPGACTTAVDTKVQVFNASCTALSRLDDDTGINYCSLLDPTTAQDTALRHLAPGTYYVQVTPYSATTAAFNYTMLLSTVALCGNGVTEGSEQCDGSANCQPDCRLVPTCGDGVVSPPEQCDDANTANGDGCSSTCQVEGVPEVEPNDTTAQADSALPAVTGNITLVAALASGADRDVFRVNVTTAGVLHMEDFDSSGADCVGMPNTTITLLSSTGTSLKTDTGTGINNCSALVANLDPGTYYVQVSGAAATPLYLLRLSFNANNGSEVEPNETVATATPEGGSQFYACADHQVGTDLDFYAVTVPAGRSIRAEVVEVLPSAVGYETCESQGVDSLLTLYSPAGTSLTNDDDAGRGYCSLIDGTGTAPVKTAAHNLPGGTYYLSVARSNLASAAGAVFNYCLAVTIR